MREDIYCTVCGKKLSNKQAVVGCCGIAGNLPWLCPICKRGYETLAMAKKCRRMCQGDG